MTSQTFKVNLDIILMSMHTPNISSCKENDIQISYVGTELGYNLPKILANPGHLHWQTIKYHKTLDYCYLS
jgi:hypothetical protein